MHWAFADNLSRVRPYRRETWKYCPCSVWCFSLNMATMQKCSCQTCRSRSCVQPPLVSLHLSLRGAARQGCLQIRGRCGNLPAFGRLRKINVQRRHLCQPQQLSRQSANENGNSAGRMEELRGDQIGYCNFLPGWNMWPDCSWAWQISGN